MGTFLTDFGLARATETHSRFTRSGEALGTPAYMSPEQARGDVSTLTSATDVWSAGCILYELVAGRPPFEGDSIASTIGQVLRSAPPALRRLRPDLPAALDAICDGALAVAPAGWAHRAHTEQLLARARAAGVR